MFKKTFMVLMSLLAINFMAAPQYVLADAKSDVCAGVGAASGASGCDANSSSTINNAVEVAIRIFQIIAGVVAIFMMIIAGLRFITSSGSSDGVKSARNTILYASIGIIIVIISEAIIQFVLNRFG